MPIYEYQCTNCEHKLEALQKISDAPLKECPACSKPDLKKLVSAASFRLKGGGWYETDFKTGNKKQLADSESSPTEKKAAAGDKAGSKQDNKASDSKPSNDKSSSNKPADNKSSDNKSSNSKTSAATASKSSAKTAGGPN